MVNNFVKSVFYALMLNNCLCLINKEFQSALFTNQDWAKMQDIKEGEKYREYKVL